mgnify:CR=1 FL=1|tara:strand:- start:304 stop:498 length:195 start_codon:yes stop_codon:yes gene_type:complete
MMYGTKRNGKMGGGKESRKPMPHGGPHGDMMRPEDEDMAMARQRKAMGGQPSYGSGEMPKAMPN